MSRTTDALGNLMHTVVPGENPIEPSSVREFNNDLDRNAFLNLLLTQLRFQDPLNPMDDREFIAQLAQFTALEQMQNLNSTFGRFQAFNMINQHVLGMTRDSATSQIRTISGRVESVRMVNGEPWLVIGRGQNEQMLRASEVQLVQDDTLGLTLSALMEVSNSNIMNQNLSMVGSYVQAITDDGRGNATGFVEGRVEFIDFSGVPAGIPPMLVIGNERVHLAQVISVADRMMLIGETMGFYREGQFTEAEITGVRLVDDTFYLVFGQDEVAIDFLNFATEALRLQGRPPAIAPVEVRHNGVTGHVTQVFANGGHVWIRINNGDPIRMSDFMQIVEPEPEEDIPWAPPQQQPDPDPDDPDGNST